MVGAATGYAPPTDLAQLGDALNLVRRDLREIGTAFKAVYELKIGLEVEIAKTAAELGGRVDTLEKSTVARIKKSESNLDTAISLAQNGLRLDLAAVVLQVDETGTALREQGATAEKTTAAALYEISQQAARDRMAAEEARREAAAQADRFLADLDMRLSYLSARTTEDIRASETRVLDRLTTNIAAGSRTIALQLIAADQKAARLHGEILSTIAEFRESALVWNVDLRDQLLEEMNEIRANCWSILWLSIKNSFKGIFKKREGN